MKNEKVQQIIDQLESGVKEVFTSGKFDQYLKVMSKFTDYSPYNSLLILFQNPSATYVAGYRAWETKFNRHVKKGEKAIRILAPCIKKEKNDEDEEEKSRLIGFRSACVFDISQTEGEDFPQICSDELKGEVNNYNSFFESIKSCTDSTVGFEEISNGAKGYFSLLDNRIAINEGMSEIQNIKTLIHEVAHSILHGDKKSKKDRATKEVEAESIAYIVSNYFGLDTSEYSFGYVAGWSADKNVPQLKESIDTIYNTSKMMIKKIENRAAH